MKNTEFFETIKNNSLLSYVFDYDPSSLDDIEFYVEQFEDMPGENIANNTQWLYRGDGRLTVMLGLYQDNNHDEKVIYSKFETILTSILLAVIFNLDL